MPGSWRGAVAGLAATLVLVVLLNLQTAMGVLPHAHIITLLSGLGASAAAAPGRITSSSAC